jgi:hypothetical protein
MTTAAGYSLEVVDANIKPLSTQGSLCIVKSHTLQEVTLFLQNTQALKE